MFPYLRLKVILIFNPILIWVVILIPIVSSCIPIYVTMTHILLIYKVNNKKLIKIIITIIIKIHS